MKKLTTEQISLLIIALVLIGLSVWSMVDAMDTRHSSSQLMKKYPAYKHSPFPLYMMNGSSYAPVSQDGFSGVRISELMQKPSFYSASREKTLQYLNNVYPTARESLASLNDMQLASFYNSLTVYYNCGFKHTGKDLAELSNGDGSTLSGEWDALPCTKLPYAPQGWFFDFNAYLQGNIPVSFFTPGVTDPQNVGNGRPGMSWLTLNPDGKKVPVVWYTGIGSARAGPGTLWTPTRVIIRDIYYPNGTLNTKAQNTDVDKWAGVQGAPFSWKYPLNWDGRLGDNEFVEVMHQGRLPDAGNGSSPGFWWNIFAGSGIFLNIGRTFACANKAGAVLLLAKKVNTVAGGSAFLEKWFGTSDPYVISFGVLAGNPRAGTDVNNPTTHPFCGIDLENKRAYIDWRYNYPVTELNCNTPDYSSVEGLYNVNYWNNPHPIQKNFWLEVVAFQKRTGIDLDSTTPTGDGVRAALDAVAANSDFNLCRIANKVLPDELVFFLGSWLDLDTVQLYADANGNGSMCYEIVDLRVPVAWKTSIKNRDYSVFLDNVVQGFDPTVGDNYLKDLTLNRKFKDSAIKEWFATVFQFVSIRDPLDIYNNDKVKTCSGADPFDMTACPAGADGKSRGWTNLSCAEVPMAEAFKCLQFGVDTGTTCRTTGSAIDC